MRKKRNIGIAFFIVAALIVVSILYHNSQKVIYNDYAINGNTPGNLYNQGLFCEINNTVYFSNPSDEYTLYSMTPQEENKKQLSEDSVYYINGDDHYLYYARHNNSDESPMSFLNVSRNSLCRIKPNGKGLEILDDDPCNYVALLQNSLYYLHYNEKEATTLYSIEIDGKDQTQVTEEAIYPCCSIGNKIYYNGVNKDHNIYVKNTVTGSASVIKQANAWMPVVDSGYLYYLDCENNYRLTRVTISESDQTGDTEEVLTSQGISSYNLYGDYLFYQTIDSKNPGMYLMDLSTRTETCIAEGNYNNINVTSGYVYFSVFDDTGRMYHMDYHKETTATPFIP